MNDEQFKQAEALRRKIFAIKDDLRVWENFLSNPSRLKYENPYDNTRAAFRASLPQAAFEAMRIIAISALQAALREAEKEFEAL